MDTLFDLDTGSSVNRQTKFMDRSGKARSTTFKLTVGLLAILSALASQTVGFSKSIAASQKDSVISRPKTQVSQYFVNVNAAKRITDSLQSSEFLAITDRTEFLKTLNKRLYQFSHDKHLSVDYTPGYARKLNTNLGGK